MPANPGEDDAPQAPQSDSVALESFSGLRNTILPERLGPRELYRARNVDIDDAGELHRRRGMTQVAAGAWHSIYRAGGRTFGVNAGVLSIINPDFSSSPILAGMPLTKLSWATVATVAYFTCNDVSGQINLQTLQVTPWGARTDHDYYPSTVPAIGKTFWLTPVPQDQQSDTLGAVAGRLLGPPPFGRHLCYFQGRLYLAQGSVLWATELYAYNFVDKTGGFRQFEDEITAIGAVEDGLYIGTRTALYFVSGTFKEQRRVIKSNAGVIPGTMTNVPAEIVDPEGRRRPDVPQETAVAISCMTSEGMVVGLKGGTLYNLTRSQFKFPRAVAGSTLFREMDGYNSIVTKLDSGGTPAVANAAMGDYVIPTLIRNGQIVPNTGSPQLTTDPTAMPQQPSVIIEGLDGTVLGVLP